MSEKATSITQCFSQLSDYRYQNIQHSLHNILTISLCATISGADDWVEIELWGLANQDWLATFLDLPHGIPSHDTFGRVFCHINAEEFEHYFMMWTGHLAEITQGEVVAIDGKQLRGSKDGELGKKGIWIVSAWASANQLVLAQEKVADKSNEITAIPVLLKLLDLEGAIVTLDALNCQTEIATAIIAQKADYILTVKGNQDWLHQDIQSTFSGQFTLETASYARQVTKGHGRLEIRQCWAVDQIGTIKHLRNWEKWVNLKTIVRVDAERRIDNKISTETRYFISSLAADADVLLSAIRSHWQIENQLHWVLDIAFCEDHSRVRKDHAPHNLAIMRHIALNLLKQDQSLRVGIKAKRKRAGWDKNYLRHILRL